MGGVQVRVSNIGSNSNPGCDLCPCEQSNPPDNCTRFDDNEENKNIWVGESNVGWYDHPCNWSKGHFPTECNTVVIPSDKIIYIEPEQIAVCYDIFIGRTGFLNVMDGGELRSEVD